MSQSGILREFQCIRDIFQSRIAQDERVVVGSGDDAAVFTLPDGYDCVTAIDTCVEGVHFLPTARPEDIAYKSVAVNLSDIAAMGAEPIGVTLSLTMPTMNKGWLERFADGLFEVLSLSSMTLLGGDMSKGSLSVSVSIMGAAPKDKVVTRSGAIIGHSVYLSGTLGDAAAALEHSLLGIDVETKLANALHRPELTVDLGVKLRGIASSMIDVSDGFLADLLHLCNASNVGSVIDVASLPVSSTLALLGSRHELLNKYMLAGGDDYVLCFTAEPGLTLPGVFEVGYIKQGKGVELVEGDKLFEYQGVSGYEHF